MKSMCVHSCVFKYIYVKKYIYLYMDLYIIWIGIYVCMYLYGLAIDKKGQTFKFVNFLLCECMVESLQT